MSKGKDNIMSSNIKIFVSCHKPCILPKCESFIPIHVGAAISDKKMAMIRDDTGDNISSKNRNYCELTAQYWAWKNYKADYYGFCHYRRFFSFSKNKIGVNKFGYKTFDLLNDIAVQKLHLNKESIKTVVEESDILLAASPDYSLFGHKNLYNQFETSHGLHVEDMKLAIHILKEKYPNYAAAADEYMNGTFMFPCNMFVMRKELFYEYSDWLFSILEKIEKEIDYSDYSEEGMRTIGHIAERLLGVFCTYHKPLGIRIKVLEWGLMEKTDSWQYPMPAFPNHNIPIVFRCNNTDLPVLDVALQSLTRCRSNNNNYDIFIFHNDISTVRQKCFIQLFSSYNNISIRFVDISLYLCFLDAITDVRAVKEQDYVLFVPDLMNNFKKVIFLDCNVLILKDPAELFNVDLSDYSIAAVIDIDHASKYGGADLEVKRLMDEKFSQCDPYQYVDTDLILFNIEKILNSYPQLDLLAFTKKMDIRSDLALNMRFSDSLKVLKQTWNIIPDPYFHADVDVYRRCVPIRLYKEYIEAKRTPSIIHFRGSEKPAVTLQCEYSDKFWDIARSSVFYEDLLVTLFVNKLEEGKEKSNNMKKFIDLFSGRDQRKESNKNSFSKMKKGKPKVWPNAF